MRDGPALSAVINVGDDQDILGLRLSPDIDIVTYTLAGLVDESKGWGIRGDTASFMSFSERLGAKPYLMLGDADLATSVYRSYRLGQGGSLEQVTDEVRRALGVGCPLFPVTNDRLTTMVLTETGWVPFEEYFVKYGSRPEVRGIRYAGSATARPAPSALEAVRLCDALVICPSNPVASVGPIAAVPGVRSQVAKGAAYRLAVSPIVSGKTVKGPADKMMSSLGFEASPLGVCSFYEGLLDGIVIDERDSGLREEIRRRGTDCYVTDTMMFSHEDKVRVASEVTKILGGRVT